MTSGTERDAPLRLGRYVDLRPLGKGAMGAVYAARDPELDRPVAIKVMQEVAADWSARFRREAQAVARLVHANIVQVYDVGTDESGNPFFVMELVDGTPLDHVVRQRGRLPPTEVARIVRQAAAGLDAAHAAGVIHRDVKPSNLILDRAGTVKLLDFGVARVLGGTASAQLTAPASLMGTPSYMAPEQATGGTVDQRADIYALGLTTFELLAGEPPYRADDLIALALKQVQEPLPDLRGRVPGVPEALARLVEKMAAKKPEDRPQSASEVVRALDAILAAASGGAEAMMPTVALPAGAAAVAAASGSGSAAPALGMPARRSRPGGGLAFATAVVSAIGVVGAVGVVVMRPMVCSRQPHRENVAPVQHAPPTAPRIQLAAAPVAGPLRVAVLRFKNVGSDKELAALEQGIGETAVGAMAGTGGVTLVERGDIDSDIGEIDRGKDVHFDKLTVAQTGKLAGVEVAVQGAFQRAGAEVRVTARFVRVASGEVLDTLTITKPASDVFGLQDAVAAGLRDKLATLAKARPAPTP